MAWLASVNPSQKGASLYRYITIARICIWARYPLRGKWKRLGIMDRHHARLDILHVCPVRDKKPSIGARCCHILSWKFLRCSWIYHGPQERGLVTSDVVSFRILHRADLPRLGLSFEAHFLTVIPPVQL